MKYMKEYLKEKLIYNNYAMEFSEITSDIIKFNL